MTSGLVTKHLGSYRHKTPLVELQKKKQKRPEVKEETLSERNKRLGKRIQDYLNGDDEYKKYHGGWYTRDKKQLAEQNRFLVVHIVKGYQGKGLSLDDLIGEGFQALMRSVEDYDPTYEFSTHLGHWIKHHIMKAIDDESRAVLKVPYHICGSRKRIEQVESVLEKELGRKPEEKEIADKFNQTFYPEGHSELWIDGYDVEILKVASRTEQLSAIREDKCFRFQSMTEQKYPDPQDIAIQKEEVKKLLSGLTGIEKDVISLYYGLDGIGPMICRDVGEMIGYSRFTIGKILEKTLSKLRNETNTEYEDKNISNRVNQAA